MSKATSYSNLLTLMLMDMPGYDETVALTALKRTGRVFCERTEAFREDLYPIAVVDYQQDYKLDNFIYDAGVQRVLWAKLNSTEVDLDDIELIDELKLRFSSFDIPHDLSPRLMTCGATPKTAYTDWSGISDGSSGFSISGSPYAVEGMDFSNVTDMDDVALVMQTGLRAEMGSNTGFVEFDDKNNKFLVWCDQAESGYLTAGASGTDISGALYMNGLEDVGVRSAHLRVGIALRPYLHTDILPSWFLDRYAITIVAGALWYLCGKQRRPWSDAVVAGEKRIEYHAGVADALIELDRGFRDTFEGPTP